MEVNFLSTRIFVTLKPCRIQTCLACFIYSFSVVVSAFAVCSTVINFIFLEIVFMKRIPLMNMISPVSVAPLYLSRMVICMGKIEPLICGIFLFWGLSFQAFNISPQIRSAPLTSIQFSRKFNIWFLFSKILKRCL